MAFTARVAVPAEVSAIDALKYLFVPKTPHFSIPVTDPIAVTTITAVMTGRILIRFFYALARQKNALKNGSRPSSGTTP